MAFFSWQFVLFLAVSLAVYYIVPVRFQWIVLLVSSAWYYVVGGGLKACIYVLVTVVTTYAGAVLMDNMQRKVDEKLKAKGENAPKLSREEKKQLKAAGQKKKKRVLVLVLLINFGILIVLKYGNFITTNMNGLFEDLHLSGRLPEVSFLIPLGLSFYTFQTMGYLIDVYRGKYGAERNPAHMALFTTYFPSVLQGPINRFDDLGTQLFEPHTFDDLQFREGLLRMLWGLFKKMVIAERAIIIVNEIFGNFETSRYAGFTMVVGILLYAVQLYAEGKLSPALYGKEYIRVLAEMAYLVGQLDEGLCLLPHRSLQALCQNAEDSEKECESLFRKSISGIFGVLYGLCPGRYLAWSKLEVCLLRSVSGDLCFHRDSL